jgi:hypothetical protein
MKFGICLLNREYSDLTRQKPIGSPEYGTAIHGANGVNVGNLTMGVNAGVRAAGPKDIHLVVEQLLKSFLKVPLNGSEIRLNLPSVKACAVIGNSQLEVAHPDRL